MTTIKILICLLFALLLLAGCGPQRERGAEEQPPAVSEESDVLTPEEIEEIIEEQLETPDEAESDEESAAALASLLEGIHTGVFPGTAGSSLSAAGRAAELADYFEESGVDPDEVDRAVQAYHATLTDEDARLFELQLDSVVGAYSALTAEGGEGLLADCGYESARFPWSRENIRNCFIALLGSD